MERTADEITRCISRSGEINDNASAELSRIRKQIVRTQAMITSKLAEFIQKNGQYLHADTGRFSE